MKILFKVGGWLLYIRKAVGEKGNLVHGGDWLSSPPARPALELMPINRTKRGALCQSVDVGGMGSLLFGQ